MKLTILFVQIFQYYFFFFKKTKTTNRHLKSQKNGPYIRTTYILMLVFIICALRVGVEIANAWRLTVDTVHNIGGRIIYAGRKRRWEGEERRRHSRAKVEERCVPQSFNPSPISTKASFHPHCYTSSPFSSYFPLP